MRLTILKEKPVREVQYMLKQGCTNFNGFDGEYVDIELDFFTIPITDGNENIYIEGIVTLHAPKSDGDYTKAWMVIKQNNPDGNHKESMSIPLSVEAAIDLCLEEV